jgi:hypothetical protein
MARDFTIVFGKLEEELTGESRSDVVLPLNDFQEVDELAELRRMVTATMEPDPASFTTT